MKSTNLAISVALACSLTATLAHAQTSSRSFTPSAYEYGNYDYYTSQPAAPAQPSTPPAAAAPANGSSSSCGSQNNCGCNSCDSCCHERLGHLCCWCPKLHPCFCWDECCPLKCEDKEICRCFDDCCWLKCHDTTLTGWASGGIMGNADNPDSHFNGPVTFADRDDGQFNQLWGALERTASADNCGWFVGGRVDFFWGSDFYFTTAAGLDGDPVGNVARWTTSDNSFLYGFSMPQLFIETTYDDLKIKWGHFFALCGYEVIPDIGNFFYTHSYVFQYGEPFTHTGVMASRPWCENWSWYAGVVSGWNVFDANARANFLGGVSYTDADYGSVAFTICTGDESVVNLAGVAPFANRTFYSLVWSRTLTSRWTYVLQHDLGVQQDANNGGEPAEWYGLNQYLFYKIDCCWSAGIRFEWFRDDDGFVVTGLRPSNPLAGNFFVGNFYEVSLGLNYKPNGNWNIRPELRWDWFDGDAVAGNALGSPYDDSAENNQFLFGLDAVYQF